MHNISKPMSLVGRVLSILTNAYLFGFFLAAVAIFLYSGNGFHKWHNSHLTPHMLGVALNLQDSNILCNYVGETCQTYHRHPPLYFFINNAIADLSGSVEGFLRNAMIFSIVSNYIGLFWVMRIFGSNNLDRLFILSIFASSTLFLANLTLSNYESLYLLFFSALAYAIKFNRSWVGYLAVLFGSVLSWFTILASLVYVLFQIRARKYLSIVPLCGGGLITLTFLLLGIDQIAENLNSAAKNIDLSGNVQSDRVYGFTQILRMIMGTVKHLVFPSVIILFLGWMCAPARVCFKLDRRTAAGLFPSLVLLFWSCIFFSWSVVHNFIYVCLLISISWVFLSAYRNFSKRVQIVTLFFLILALPFQHVNVVNGYQPLAVYENSGVQILKAAIDNYGNFND